MIQALAKEIFDKVEITGSGKGKFDLYNKTIPSYLKKYAKKWNAKVYDDAAMDSIATQKAKFGVKNSFTVLELSER